MRRPGGYTFLTDLDTGRVIEGESYTCKHCNRVTFVKPKERAEDLGGLCKMCMGLLCKQCVATGVCDPFEKKLLREYEIERWGRK